MSDTQVATDPVALAQEQYKAIQEDIDRLSREIESEPLDVPTPTLDRHRKEQEKAEAERRELEKAQRRRQAQLASLRYKEEQAYEAVRRVEEEAKEAERKRQYQVEERLAYDRARKLREERETRRRIESLTGQIHVPSSDEQVAQRISQLLGLPVTSDAVRFAGSASGEEHYTWHYHGFHGWARYDIEGVELRPKSPAHAGLISLDPLDYLDIDWLVEKEKEFAPQDTDDTEGNTSNE